MAREQRLAAAFVEVAGGLIDDFDVIEFLQRLSVRCADLLDVSAVGILLADAHGHLQTIAASDENTRLLELFALQNAEGPCADCHHTGRARLDIDLTDPAVTAQWPGFARRARDAGFAMTHAIPLRLRSTVVGAMNLFTATPSPLDRETAVLAQALADIATVTILRQRSIEQNHIEKMQLQNALTSRIMIEQAKGVLAERWQVSVDEAFGILRGYARSHQLRLVDLARQVIDGEVDTDAVLRHARTGRRPGAPRR
ncbi:GAF and ANTAR domain-containing protein [Streptomyces sp. NPDC003077]|uniref:GAF and ANTAR domain-containing protein n=1 Tax=Streptomyces sp. NPDC003077 TaxID=3154443 RepID=UPI0033B9DE4F